MDHHTLYAPDLFARSHRADAPFLWDVRTVDDTNADPTRLPGAAPLSLAQIKAGAGGTAPCVVYCQKGGKISQLAASLLRARGVDARGLHGGHLGWVDAALPTTHRDVPQKWVMPLMPNVGELCALWLLRRLIAPSARIMPVAPDQVAAAADVWPAKILPDTPTALEDLAEMSRSFAMTLPMNEDIGFARLLRGRLARGGDPFAALDLIDDDLAGESP